jgi:nucleoside-diphosphate-sugar epimerase
MKILVTGATGYIGGAAAKALSRSGHKVFGLSRSDASAARLQEEGLTPVRGDFADPASLARAARAVDVIVSTASTGAVDATPQAFADDRAAVGAMLAAIEGAGKTLIFTSGSAVIGVLGRGEASEAVFDEDVHLPLAESVFAPADAGIPAPLTAGLGTAMAARIWTEQDVLTTPGVRGIVMRPGLVYGDGASYDIPGLIRIARANGEAPHLGSGALLQAYVHIDDLGELYKRGDDARSGPREVDPIGALERPCARNSEVAGKSPGRRVSRSRPSGESRPTNPLSWPAPFLVSMCRCDGPAQDIAQWHQPSAGLGPAALAAGGQGKDLG